MQKSDNQQAPQFAHRRVKSSTTLSRRYVKQPQSQVSKNLNISHIATTDNFQKATPKKPQGKIIDAAIKRHPIQTTANAKMHQRAIALNRPNPPKPTAKQLKDEAIKKALSSTTRSFAQKPPKEELQTKISLKSIFFALMCTAATVLVLLYFVNVNMPDISLRVAAMQTGIEASYPSYVPADYGYSNIASENNIVILNFKQKNTNESFSISEEKSSWDSATLLNVFVKNNYSQDYITLHEQGLYIYLDNNDACWVKGGIIFKLHASTPLSKQQIKSIAVSL